MAGASGPEGRAAFPSPPVDSAGPPVEHPQAGTIRALGLVSLFVPVLGPVAWVQARRALAEIDAEPGRYLNRSAVATGRTLGVVGTVLLVLAVAWMAVAVVFVLISIADGTFDTG